MTIKDSKDVMVKLQRRRAAAESKKARIARVKAAITAARKAADGDSGDEEHQSRRRMPASGRSMKTQGRKKQRLKAKAVVRSNLFWQVYSTNLDDHERDNIEIYDTVVDSFIAGYLHGAGADTLGNLKKEYAESMADGGDNDD
jgi:hypothetical protein